MSESAPVLPSAKKLLANGHASGHVLDGHAPINLNDGQARSAPDAMPAPAIDDPPGPADLRPPATWWERLCWYSGAVILTIALLIGGLRLDAQDLHAPLNYDSNNAYLGSDVFLIMPMVKAMLEQGSHWRNERLGFPGTQELYDFPVIDHLHFGLIWLIGQVVPDWIVAFNLYFLLTWPLTTLTAMYAFRHLRLTLPMAAAGGVLYAFLPYHYLRGELHYFLAAYWMIPLSWLPALDICKGNLPFFRREPDGRYRLSLFRWKTLCLVALAAATASAGAYYAFFACAVYAVAGAYAWFVQRTWKATAAAAVMAGLVSVFGMVNHLPSFIYTIEHGPNSVTTRYPDEVELYALKIAHLLLPIDGHSLPILSQLKNHYNSPARPLNTENTAAPLGVIGSVGFMILVIVLLLPAQKRWPYGPLATLAGFIVLYATIGGFSSLVNMVVFEQIRSPNRFSVYLAFICLFAALWPLDRFLLTRTGGARRLRLPVIAGLIALGIYDQTPAAWFHQPLVESTASSGLPAVGDIERFHTDRRFFAQIEATMPPGSKIFTLPYIQFPEVSSLYDMACYEPVRGFLHTNRLIWSYGAMKNREADMWQQQVALGPHAEFLDRIVCRGFDGLFVDERGFPSDKWNDGEAIIAYIKETVEKKTHADLPLFYHPDGKQAFLDLRPYRDWLMLHDPVRFESESKRERDCGVMVWLEGFSTYEPNDLKDRWVQSYALARLVNPSGTVRRYKLSATFVAEDKVEHTIKIDGPGITEINKEGGAGPWVERIVLTNSDKSGQGAKKGQMRTYVLEAPPGQHFVVFRCSPSCAYAMKDVSFEELK